MENKEQKLAELKEAIAYCLRHNLISLEEVKNPHRSEAETRRLAIKALASMRLHKKAHPEAE